MNLRLEEDYLKYEVCPIMDLGDSWCLAKKGTQQPDTADGNCSVSKEGWQDKIT